MSHQSAARTVPCSRNEAKTRRQQARAFLDVADLVLDEVPESAQPHVAAALAVLAAIAATDAICGLTLGRYSRGQDHRNASELLETVSLTDRTLPSKLRRILAAKDRAHYSPHLLARDEAKKLVRQAAAIVEVAEQL